MTSSIRYIERLLGAMEISTSTVVGAGGAISNIANNNKSNSRTEDIASGAGSSEVFHIGPSNT